MFPVCYVFCEEDLRADAAYYCCVPDSNDGAAGGVGEGAGVEGWRAGFGGSTA